MLLTFGLSGLSLIGLGIDYIRRRNELIAAVRGTGSRVVLLAGGIYWAESMARWLEYRHDDPLGQVAASFHAYSFNEYCADPACYDRDLAPLADQVPLVAGEVGPALEVDAGRVDQDCPRSAVRSGGWAAETLEWLDDHGAGWTAWSWNPWGDCWSLVRDWDGEPAPVWGEALRRRLAAA